MNTVAIARLKIALDDVKPLVMRRLEVPLSIRLDRLHLAIQAAMGWTNSHLYEIRTKDAGWGIPDPDWGGGPLDARKARLIDVLEDVGTKTLKYLYDFGDGWEHTIKIERLIDPLPGIIYPRLTEAAGRCPPEDIGGPWGYAEFLAAISDPGHSRHAEFKEWIGEEFDPKIVDADWLGEQVAALAKRWSRTSNAQTSAPEMIRGAHRRVTF
jgi:Plasmid pRiA4b ORF-3-like protein